MFTIACPQQTCHITAKSDKINRMTWQINDNDKQLIEIALAEDLSDNTEISKAYRDITSDYLFADHSKTQKASIISKHYDDFVFCGRAVIEAILSRLSDNYVLDYVVEDGAIVSPGASVAIIESDSKTLVIAERTILNFLQHLCGIATLTRQFVDKIADTSTKILDTRKTLPGFRHLDKYAVHCGGGVNHRMGLYDAIMIKDNHIDALGGVAQAMAKLPDDILNHYPVIVEVRDSEQLAQLIHVGSHKVSRVLLDNMSTRKLAAGVKLCKNVFPTEASGGINLENIAAIAATGVDYASVGSITHSAASIDLSMSVDIS
ncbi:MAG: carboxylating nicotinate-nucleotide diphosphorylase [Pseudomonadota bacterium]